MRWRWRVFVDALLAMAGLVAVFLGVALVLDGVEQVRLASTRQELSIGFVVELLLERIPTLVGAVVPIAAAVTAVGVVGAWRRRGALTGLASIGVSPGAFVVPLALACSLVAGASLIARESFTYSGGPSGWVSGELGGLTLVGHGQPLGERLVDLSLVVRDGARVVGVGTASEAHRHRGGWRVIEGRLASDRPLPDLGSAHLSSGALGSRSSLAALLRAPASPARSAWLLERFSVVGLALLLALQAGLLSATAGRLATSTAVVVAVVTTISLPAVVEAVALGSWPLWAAAAVVGTPSLLAVAGIRIWRSGVG